MSRSEVYVPILDATAILLVLAAAFGFFNHHVLKLPFTIGLLVSGLLASMGVLAIDALAPDWQLAVRVRKIVHGFHFADTVLNGMLSLLLFAGALHTDLGRLKQKTSVIFTLASLGVLVSATVAGLAAYAAFRLTGLPVALVWCLAFGALISPTDPIAVLGIMKAASAPEQLEIKVIGESLFNDGTGVVLFTILVGVGIATASGGTTDHVLGAGVVTWLLAKEILGGIALGLLGGYVCYRGFRTLDEPNLEILMTVATIFAIGALATKLHVSSPLAAVSAGLLIGNRGRYRAMSERTSQNLDVVWAFIDEMLNAVLFLMIGLEVFGIDYSQTSILSAFALIPLVLIARWVGVVSSVAALRIRQDIDPGTVRILTWGGLKGGVSVALAMKLPAFSGRDAVLTATYTVVIFSIVVQGLTLGRMIRRMYPPPAAASARGEELA